MKLLTAVRGLIAATMLSTVALTGCADSTGGASGDLEDVNFGYIADFNGTSLLAIAEDQGLWEKNGLKAKTSVFTNGPLQIQALGTGDLDFGYIGPGAMWLPASGQADIVALNSLGNADRVIAQPGINSIEDLKGKKVAVPEGTSGDMILTLALEKAGMSVDDIEKVPMDPSTVVSAFASKQVDAAGIWYPLISTLEQQVPDLVTLAQNSDFSATVQFPTAFVSPAGYGDENPEKTQKVLKVLREALDYRAANMDETIELTAGMLKLDNAQVAADAANVEVLTSADIDAKTADGTIDKWFTGMNDYFVAAGKLPAPVAPKTYYKGEKFVEAGR